MKTAGLVRAKEASGSERKPGLTRLRRVAQPGRSLTVDRTFPGAIRGLSAIMTGAALGHGFDVDDTTVTQIASALGGVPGRWTHGGLSGDGLARHLGQWKAKGVEAFDLCRGCNLDAPVPPEGGQAACPGCGRFMEKALRALGDFEFSASAHKIKPDGLDIPAPVYLMDRAKEDPRTLGISVVARFDFEETPELDDKGNEINVRRVARLASEPKALARADFVADPAANPLGLHSGTSALSELSEEAFAQLDKIFDRLGADETRARVGAFFDRYLALKEASVKLPEDNTPLAADAAGSIIVDLAKKPVKADKPVDDSDEESDDEKKADDDEADEDLDEDGDADDVATAKGKKPAKKAASSKCASCDRHVAALSALRAKYVQAKVAEAQRRANELGVPIDGDTALAVSELYAKGDETSEKLADHMLRLAVGVAKDKPKPFAQLANPGLKKVEDATPDRALQEQMLSQMGYERTPDGDLRKKKGN